MLAQLALLFVLQQRDSSKVERKDPVAKPVVAAPILKPPIVIATGPKPRYEIREITLGADFYKAIRPYALNNRGDLVGTYESDMGSGQPVLFTANGPAWFLDFGGVPRAIDDTGKIGAILYGDNGLPTAVPVKWSPKVGSTLVKVAGDLNITSVNASGDWVGVETGHIKDAGKRYLNGTLTSLPPLPGFPRSYGSMITNGGSVIGASYGGNPLMAVTLWRPGKGPVQIKTPPGFKIFDSLLLAKDGTVTGTCKTSESQLRPGEAGVYAFVTRKGLPQLIPFPCEVKSSQPFAINANGDIVGEAMVDDKGTRRAWLYRNGETYFLDDLVRNSSAWKTVSGFCINDRGVVAGIGVRVGEGTKSFLMEVLEDGRRVAN